MFGLEKDKKDGKGGNNDFVFDLENEFQDGAKNRKHKKHVEEKIQRVKQVLRSGENKEEFDQFGVLLHGYTSLIKVISRFKTR